MALTFFARLRARQWKRKLEKAVREAAEASLKHAEVMARAQTATATFLAAERIGAPPDLLQRLGAEATAAIAAMNEMHQAEIAEMVRALDLVGNTAEEK
jgi:hypothetical protein